MKNHNKYIRKDIGGGMSREVEYKAHTPTPWRQINAAIFDTIPWNKDQTRHTVPALFIPGPQQQDLEINKANSAFIVRAVNSHEALIRRIEILGAMLRKATGWTLEEIAESVAAEVDR